MILMTRGVTRGGWFGGLWHPATLAAASVPPNGFVYEGALGKSPLNLPGASRFWAWPFVYAWRLFTRGGVFCFVVASCHERAGVLPATRFVTRGWTRSPPP
jgi:hypothetical protein